MDSSKVQAVLEWPIPSNVKQLRAFLGLTGYYRRFIRNYANIAAPLIDLLKKDAFVWSASAQSAFDDLKQAMTAGPVLALPDFSQPFVLETDASGIGIGAVLSQKGHPIAFFSKKMPQKMQKQGAYVRELYAITESLAKFRHYLLGHKFTIRTDQQSLRHLMDQTLQTPEQQAWLHKFLGYDFQIEYKAGKDNIPADALSRSFYMAWSAPQTAFWEDIKKAQVRDASLWKKLQQQTNLDFHPHQLIIRDNIIFINDRVFIPKHAKLIAKILHEFHASPIGGHAGIKRTAARISALFYWQGMQKDIKQYVTNCTVCQQAKTLNTSPAGLLQPLPIPAQVWEDISMDFITGLPNSGGYTAILVVVDRLSKYAHFMPMKSDYTAKQVAELFFNTVVKLHGMPKSIVSDRDKVFTSIFWQ